MYNQFQHLSLFAVTFMASSTTCWSCLTRVVKFRTLDMYSWEILLTVVTIQLRHFST